MTSNVPRARAQLAIVAARLAEEGFHEEAGWIRSIVVKYLVRRSPVRRARIKVARMSRDLAYRIRSAAADDPTLSHLELAGMFRVNPGRVSEALSGRWTGEKKFDPDDFNDEQPYPRLWRRS